MKNVKSTSLFTIVSICYGTYGLYGTGTAHAQSAAHRDEKKGGSHVVSGKGVQRSASRPAAPVAASATPEVLQVSGHRSLSGGLMTHHTSPISESTVTAAAIAQRPGASNALQLIGSMPGVNANMSDPYGMSVRNDFSVRGLSQTEMGFVLEGAPISDPPTYFPYTEGWADNENYKDIGLTPGTSKISDPVMGAAGGVMTANVRDPSDKMGGELSYMYGSYDADRVFARYDTGLLGRSGIKMFGSYSWTAADNFRGVGRNYRTHVDYKIMKEWENLGSSSLYVSYNNDDNMRLNIPNMSGWLSGGLNDNYADKFTKNTSTYYKFNLLPRQTILASFKNEFHPTQKLSVFATPYFHWTDTSSPGGANMTGSTVYTGTQQSSVDLNNIYNNNGTYTVMTQSLQNEYQAGINLGGQYKLPAHNTLSFGYWYDNFQMSQLNGMEVADQNGNVRNDRGGYLLRDVDGDVVAGEHFRLGYQINAIYLSDKWTALNNRLVLEAGFREFMQHVSGTNEIPGPQHNFSSNISEPLPRFMASFQIDRHNQVFLNATTNTRAPVATSTYVNAYSVTTGKLTQAAQLSTRPEYAISEEVGYRHTGVVNVNLTFFNTNLTNHQVNTIIYQNGAMIQSAISAGGETLRGATLELSTRPFHGFAPYFSGQYLHATTDNNIEDGSDYAPTKGKVAVRSPRFMLNVGLTYNHGPFFGNVMFKWVDKQYSTFMDNEVMPSYEQVDLALGYHFHPVGIMRSPTLKLNFLNLGNTAYLGSIASPTITSKSITGIHGGAISASAPGYYVMPAFTCMFTVSTGF